MAKQTDSDPTTRRPRVFGAFQPILSGATFHERLLGCLGACIGISVTAFSCTMLAATPENLPLIVAPIGASAVLLFAVPASPLAQPWPIIGGNTISALVGVAVTYMVLDTMLAAGIAVSLAILMMSLTRSLHPPGGAAALTAVIGGTAVTQSGFWFPLVPVALNSIALVCVGLIFHRLARRTYPHRVTVGAVNSHKTNDEPPSVRIGFSEDDIESALLDMNETLDITRGDIERLLRQVELHALIRVSGEIPCRDIMSRDIVSVSVVAAVDEARALLLSHNIRTLPVLNRDGTLAGTTGLRELAGLSDKDPLPITPACTAKPSDPSIGLLPSLTDGLTHAVVIINDLAYVEGIVTQTDLLVTLSRRLLVDAFTSDRAQSSLQ